MSVKQVMMEILSGVRLKRLVDSRNAPFISAQAVSYGEAFDELSQGHSQDVVDAVAKQLPETFLINYALNRSALNAVAALFDVAVTCELDLEAAIEASDEAKGKEKSAAAEKESADAREAVRIAREQSATDAAIEAEMKAKSEAKAAAAKAERNSEAKRLADIGEADRQKMDAEKAAVVSEKDELPSITQQEFDESPLSKVLSHQGAVNAYGKEGLSTVNDIAIFRQSRSLTEVRGIGEDREKETIEEIETYRKRIQ